MNILLITHTYPDINKSWRGSFVKEQARALSLNHNVVVVFFKVDYQHFAPFTRSTFSKCMAGNLTEFTISIKKSFPVFNQPNYLCRTYKFICDEILSDFKPDVIHSHLTYPGGFLGTIIQMRKKIPNIITEHSRIKTYFRSWIHGICVRYTLKNAASIVAVSNSLKKELFLLWPREIKVIHNFIDTNKFQLTGSEPGPILNIGFLGGLGNNNKGLDLLLKSASLLENKNYLLHVGGDGHLKETYRQMAKEYGIEANCQFYGEIAHDKIPEFYLTLDLFVLPSRYETFGIVLIEAMACGIPVIATRCGGPEEIITESTGILIQKENTEELKEAITSMRENLLSFNKTSIRKYVVDNFGQQVFLQKVTEHYKEIITVKRNE